MPDIVERLLQTGERRSVAWAAASATVSVLLLSLLKRLPWALSGSEGTFADSNVLIVLAVGVFVVSMALTWVAIRTFRAPAWIWLAPACVAAWSLLFPLVLLLGYGWEGMLARLEVNGLWNAFSPLVAIALPSIRAARVASPDHQLLPADDRALALGLAGFGFLMLAVNGIAAELASGAFSTLTGPLRDDQALALAFIFDLAVPFMISLLFTAFRLVPASAWAIVAGPALAYILASFIGGEPSDALVYAWFLVPLAATVTMGCFLGGLVASRFKKGSEASA